MDASFFGNLGGLGNLDMLGGNLAGPLQQGAVSDGQMPGMGFTSLLDIVSDLQIADEQSGDLEGLVGAELDKLSYEDNLSIKANNASNFGDSAALLSSLNAKGNFTISAESQLGSPIDSSNSGLMGVVSNANLLKPKIDKQSLEQVVDPIEQIVDQVEQIKPNSSGKNLDSLNTFEDLSFLSKQNLSKAPGESLNMKSVEAWALPLLSNDIEDIQTLKPKLSSFEKAVNITKFQPNLSADKFQNLSKLNDVSDQKIDLGINSIKSKDFQVDASILDNASANVVIDDKKQSKESSKLETLSKPAVSMSGADFLIEGMGEANSEKSEGVTVIDMPERLLNPADNRVSTKALNFVANKVDDLKAQGGGQLTVKLNPNELGSVQIDVSQGVDGLKVTLSATKQSTLDLFTNSSKELEGALLEKGTVLEISSMSKPVEKVHVDSLNLHKSINANAEASSDFMQMRDSESMATKSSTSMASSVAESINGVGASKGSSVFSIHRADSNPLAADFSAAAEKGHQEPESGSDSKREEAHQRWREQFDDRESA